MPLDKSSLIIALEAALGAGEAGLDTPSKTNIEKVASDMGDAIDTFVKSGLVTTAVTTAVACAGAGGTGTGSGAGTGSVT